MINLKTVSLRHYFSAAVFKLLVFAPFNVFGQFTAVTTPVGGDCGGFWQYLPPSYTTSPTTKYPIIFFLHGIGELGSGSNGDLQRLLIYGPTKLIHTGQWPAHFTVGGKNFECIVITPQFRWWPGPSDLDSVIAYALRNYRVDTTRMYMTGLSMGGGALWTYVTTTAGNAKRMAAVAPVSGAAFPEPAEAAVLASTNLPVWALHNLNDPTVPSTYSVDWVNYINSYVPIPNPKALLTIFQANGHDSWDSAYNLNYRPRGLNVFEWMLQYSRGAGAPPPVLTASAGADTTLTLPSDTALLSASRSNDVGASITGYQWTQDSGPAAQLLNSGSVNAQVVLTTPGKYQFSVLVKDNQGDQSTSKVTVQLNADPPASLPVAHAGADTTLTFPADSLMLNAAASTDSGASITGWLWSQVSGPAATLSSPDRLEAPVILTTAGQYVFSVRILDSKGDSASGQITVKLVSASPASDPAAGAGPDTTLTLPSDSLTLNAAASTDSGASITGYLWSQVSGPAATIASPNSMLAPVTLTTAGQYLFSVKIRDGLGNVSTATDTVRLSNPPSLSTPVANAGTDTTLTLPLDSIRLSAAGSTDTGGTITGFSWNQISGPSALLESPDSQSSEVSGLNVGKYVFSLVIRDNLGDSAASQVTITVASQPPPDSSASSSANDYIPPDNDPFLYGTNLGFYSENWTDEQLSTIATFAGMTTERLSLADNFLAKWGYGIRQSTFSYYQNPLGLKDLTVFLNQPRAAWRDPTTYPGSPSQSLTFANLYDSVWNSDGTINPNNYYATYVYNVVSRYGGQVKFWEVWNEPDVNNGTDVYYPPGQPGNWYDNPPPVGELYGFYAPVFSYIRMLRITYQIVHKLFPNEYVCTGGIGYPSFLDALLRYTDNPDNGKVTPQYPLKGGAYIDVISYHCYPEYTLRYWTNAGGGHFVETRTSDYAAAVPATMKASFQAVLQKYGYDGTLYPQKPFIITESNISRKQFSTYIGSDIAQRNFAIKVLVKVQQNQIDALDFFTLGESSGYASASSEYQLMGLYQDLTKSSYGVQQYTQEGEAVKTTSQLLNGYVFDSNRTAQLNLPPSVDGAAFIRGGKYIYVLWAKCLLDQSENASATYTFPGSLGITSMMQYGWDYSVNQGDTASVHSSTVNLGGTPVFLTPGTSFILPGPQANAGPNKTIISPANSVVLDGTGSTDQSGSIVRYRWQEISGPIYYNIVTPNSATTQVTGMTLGQFIFALTVVDNNGDSSTSDVEINVNPTGGGAGSPVAKPGGNQTITLPLSSANVNGSSSFSPLGKIISYTWSQTSGPVTANIQNPDSAATGITNLVQTGSYSFTLTVTDNMGATASAGITITVNPEVFPSPVANAGNNQTISLPQDSITLDGTGSSDPGGLIVGYRWAQVSGPSPSLIQNDTASKTGAGNLQAGTYVFSLKVGDNHGQTSSVNVTITVNPAPTIHPPVAVAGPDTTLVMPLDSLVLNGSASTDTGGTITSYTWSESSGPAAVFVHPDSALSPVRNLSVGKYVFTLTIRDSQGLSSTDSAVVLVNPAADIPPVANAGPDQTITLPADSAILDGTGSTDASGTIAGYRWTQLSGPSAARVASGSGVRTAVDSLIQGVYKFQLTVTDTAGASSLSDMTITVNPAVQQAPVANAGSNINMTLPLDSAVLNGSGSYAPGGNITSYSWTEVSGPSAAHFAAPDSSVTGIDSLVAGNYVFALTVTNGSGSSSNAQVQVTVNIATHLPPVANAGTDATITLPADSVILNGSLSSDPDGTITSYNWSRVSGPAAYSISGGNKAIAGVSGLTQGTYKFTLTVTDNFGDFSSATVTITVNPPPAGSLVASAGNNVTITLPLDSTILTGASSYDTKGTITGYAWTQLAGPATFNLAYPDSSRADLTNLGVGTYEFGLKVSDNLGLNSASTVTVTVVQALHQPPSANAGSDITIRLPQNSATLDGSGSTDPDGTITSYSWSNLSGPYGYSLTGAAASKASLGNLSAGVYEFQLTVTDNFGLSATDTVQVTVNSAPDIPPVAVAGSNINLTLPLDSTQLDGSSSYDPDGTVVSYNWALVSGSGGVQIIGTNAAKAQVTGLIPGTYIFRLTVTDNGGLSSFSQVTVTVSRHVPPVASAGGNINIVLPVNSASLDGTGSYDSDGTITSYNWTQISGPSTDSMAGAGSAHARLTGLTAGIYVFQLTVTDNAGSVASATVTVTVNSAPATTPVANAGPGTTLTLPANSTMLDGSASRDNGGTIVAYRWTELSGPSTYRIANPDSSQTGLSGLVEGDYVFLLTITNNTGETASAQVTVTVNPPPVHPPVSYAGPDIQITLPVDTATLNGSGSYEQDGTIVFYSWTEVSGPSTYTLVGSNRSIASLSGLVTGTYVFELTVKDSNGAQATSDITVTVNAAPNIPPVSNAGTDTTITLPSDTVTLNGSASYAVDGRITAYQWKEVAGPSGFIMSDSMATRTMVTGLVAGSYLFSLTVTDANGLKSTSQVEVTVNLNSNVTNGQVVVYPNPAVNVATVYFYNNQDGKIGVNLYDMWGRLRHSYTFIKDHQAIFKENIDLTGLPPGVYLVQVSINGTFSTSVKLEKLSN